MGILINDASSIGKYLFVTLIALIIASLIGLFIHNSLHTVITVVSLLLFYFIRFMILIEKRGQFSPREMGFNLFINLLNIIKDILRLANRFKN